MIYEIMIEELQQMFLTLLKIMAYVTNIVFCIKATIRV